ncbi:hypothetical protein AT959_18595 [Dechloromonas denitrificans]|uniref:Uncharacterized protein n=1 Tax=Dechloromonas denitrificans TaxID=281362 RepID=A0A133XE43_9RHOO|nr:hypothetical protein [Dechloromonas denitrificans]KXB29196.1 hypothetical protein AT959_18595 [Dechloromonas denitrificans]
MQIRQLQIANDSVQDRLMLRVGTQANEEYRIYFTRRFLREIWPHLVEMLNGHLSGQPVTVVEAEAAPGEAATFEQSFIDDNPSYPLGATPLLASEAVLEASGDGTARLILREGRERRFTLELTAEILHALCAMLRAANDQAGWDLTLAYDSPAPISQQPPTGKTLLH